jgi:hypothetical protein
MSKKLGESHIYDGGGDDLMERLEPADRIILLPDSVTSQRDPDPVQRIRIMWGQRLIDDLIAGRYRTLVCAVNAHDNSHGFINLLAERLPTSQWREETITAHAAHFVQPRNTTVVKYDMDRVEVLAMLRPKDHNQLTLQDLATGFRIVSAMLRSKPERFPSASVCFLGARANKLVDGKVQEPSLEAVLSTMYEAGYRGDVYPAPWMWESTPCVFARYPFPDNIKEMREGGF